MDEMIKVLNGNRGDAAFLSNKMMDSVRITIDGQRLRYAYAWKAWLLQLCFGLAFGPGFTMIVIRAMAKKGQNLAGLVDEIGYYFAIAGGAMLLFLWGFAIHTLVSRRYVEFDFDRREVLFRYFGFGNVSYVIPLADVAGVQADTVMRRASSESSRQEVVPSHVLVLSLRDSRKIKVFETRNQDFTRQAADTIDAHLQAEKETAGGKRAKGYSGLGW